MRTHDERKTIFVGRSNTNGMLLLGGSTASVNRLQPRVASSEDLLRIRARFIHLQLWTTGSCSQ